MPADLHAERAEAREAMVEAMAEVDDTVMEPYLEAGDADPPAEVPRRPCAGPPWPTPAVPVLCGSALRNKGVQPLLDAIVDYLPSPLGPPPGRGVDPRDRRASRPAGRATDAPLAALAFKVMSDPHAGQLTYFRVYSGVAQAGDAPQRHASGKSERSGACCACTPTSREESHEVSAGNIVATVG